MVSTLHISSSLESHAVSIERSLCFTWIFLIERIFVLAGVEQEHICGRPLGLAFDTIGDNLIVADAYYGIYEVNLKTAATNQLISTDNEIGGLVSDFYLTKNILVIVLFLIFNFRSQENLNLSTL